MPRLSIIIPVYNVEKYLRKCLDSVTYPDIADYEIVIVNDGSTDSSLAIAEEYAARYPSLIRLTTTPNGGLGHARNLGLEMALGEYIVFLDSDDHLCENAVAEMLEEIDSGFDICVFDMLSVNEDGRVLNYINGCLRSDFDTLEDFPALLLEAPAACNKLFKRSLFIESNIRFPGRVWYEDLRTIPKLYLYAGKIKAVSKAWYIYLQRSGSITNNANTEKNLEIIDAVEDLTGYYRDLGVYDKFKNELGYIAYYHQLIAAVVRVNLSDRKSPVQDKLLDAYLKIMPDCADNRYISSAPRKFKLLFFLIKHRAWLALQLVMKLNNLIKRKKI